MDFNWRWVLIATLLILGVLNVDKNPGVACIDFVAALLNWAVLYFRWASKQ